jgi:hypothetical protein
MTCFFCNLNWSKTI